MLGGPPLLWFASAPAITINKGPCQAKSPGQTHPPPPPPPKQVLRRREGHGSARHERVRGGVVEEGGETLTLNSVPPRPLRHTPHQPRFRPASRPDGIEPTTTTIVVIVVARWPTPLDPSPPLASWLRVRRRHLTRPHHPRYPRLPRCRSRPRRTHPRPTWTYLP